MYRRFFERAFDMGFTFLHTRAFMFPFGLKVLSVPWGNLSRVKDQRQL